MAKKNKKTEEKKDEELDKLSEELDKLLEGDIDTGKIVNDAISEKTKGLKFGGDIGKLISAIPLADIINPIVDPFLAPVKASLEMIKPQILELKKTVDKARKEKNKNIKAAMKQRIAEVKKKLEDLKNQLIEQIKQIVETTVEKIKASIAEAENYFQQIKQAGQAIPPAVQGVIIQITSFAVQTSGSISAAVMNPGSVAFTAPSILTSLQDIKKAIGDLQAANKQLITSIAQVEKCLSILFVVPGLKILIMTPINTIGTLVSTLINTIPSI